MTARTRLAVRSWRRTAPDQVAGVWQGRAEASAWRLRLRRRRLPGGYLAGVLGVVAALIAGPYAEELWRCAKTGKG